jgi:hypothetical protein
MPPTRTAHARDATSMTSESATLSDASGHEAIVQAVSARVTVWSSGRASALSTLVGEPQASPGIQAPSSLGGVLLCPGQWVEETSSFLTCMFCTGSPSR